MAVELVLVEISVSVAWTVPYETILVYVSVGEEVYYDTTGVDQETGLFATLIWVNVLQMTHA
jgi:hypothetical protein